MDDSPRRDEHGHDAPTEHAARGAAADARRRDKIRGAVLGAAIGDAMGHPTEFLTLAGIRARYGDDGVTGFALYWGDEGARFAPYTDDTQLAEVVLRALLDGRDAADDHDATMARMAAGIAAWATSPMGGHRGPGNACLTGAGRIAAGHDWRSAGDEDAGGCGSVMRAYPFALLFADDARRAEAWAVSHSRMTHRDPIALAACAAMGAGVSSAIADFEVDRTLGAMRAAAARHSEPTAAMIARAVDEARAGVVPDVTLDRLRGWAAHEAIAAAAYVLARHPDDPRGAILEGANTPGDSDSIATLAGALVGARTGLTSLPPDWVRDVERSADLLALADRV